MVPRNVRVMRPKKTPGERQQDADNEPEQHDHDPQMNEQRAQLFVRHFSIGGCGLMMMVSPLSRSRTVTSTFGFFDLRYSAASSAIVLTSRLLRGLPSTAIS